MNSASCAQRLCDRRWSLALLFSLATVFASCGGSDSSESGSVTSFASRYRLVGLWSFVNGRDAVAAVKTPPFVASTFPTLSMVIKQRLPNRSWTALTPDFALPPHTEVVASVAASGEALIAWIDASAGRFKVFAATHSSVGGWSAPMQLPGSLIGIARNLQVATDAAGRFHVAWLQFGNDNAGAPQHLWAVTKDPALGWQQAHEVGPTNVNDFSLAGDRDGDGASLAWHDIDDAGFRSVFVAARGRDDAWHTAPAIQRYSAAVHPLEVPYFYSRAIARVGGRTLLVYEYSAAIAGTDPLAGHRTLYSVHCNAAPVCTPPRLVDGDPARNESAEAVDLLPNGDAALVWIRTDTRSGAFAGLVGARFDGTAWSSPQPIDNAAVLDLPRVCFDTSERLIAVWPRALDRRWAPYGSRSENAGPWSAPAVVAEAGDSNASLLQLATRAGGGAIVGWTQPDGQPGSVGDGTLYLADLPR